MQAGTSPSTLTVGIDLGNRQLAAAASTPWYLTGCVRGLGTRAARSPHPGGVRVTSNFESLATDGFSAAVDAPGSSGGLSPAI